MSRRRRVSSLNANVVFAGNLHIVRDVTRADFVRLLEELERTDAFFDNRLVPQAITEGGISLKSPVPSEYKCIRLLLENFVFPRIDETTVIEEWRHDSTVLYRTGLRGVVVLKTFRGAPRWTPQQLMTLRMHFSVYGIDYTKLPKCPRTSRPLRFVVY